jgi:hypothetical protein
MKTSSRNPHRNLTEHAQSMVEFALLVPLVLLIIFGMIEFGHLLASYSMLTNATRDAARYASAAGDVGGGLPHYLDCAGIRAAARRNAVLLNLPDENIQISYDSGPNTAVVSTNCPATVPVSLGMRVVIRVSFPYEPLVPVAGIIEPFVLNSTTVRTILTNVEVQGTPGSGGAGTPQVYFSMSSDDVGENDGNYTLQVRLSSANTADTVVPFAVSGSAAYCDDFSVSANSLSNVCEGPVTGTFLIPAGQTGVDVTIAVSNDSIDEYDETVILTLSKPSNANLGSPIVFQLTIADDDDPPTVSFSSAGQSGGEALGGLTGSVILSGLSGKTVTVPYFVTDAENSAKVGVDYTLGGSSVTILPGSLGSSFAISLINDLENEGDETFTIHLGTPSEAALGSPDTHVVTILDDDELPTVYFDVDVQAVGEDVGVANVLVRLSAPSSVNVTVPFSLNGSATQGSDYTLSPASSITILAGQVSANIAVTVIRDDAAARSGGAGNAGNPKDVAAPKTKTPTPTNSPIPPTATHTATITRTPTPIHPTATNTATQTALPPTSTRTNTPVPPTATNTALPPTPTRTNTSMPPTATSTGIAPSPTSPAVEGNETVIITLGNPLNNTAVLGSPAVHTLTILDGAAGQPQVAFAQSFSEPVAEGVGQIAVRISLSNVWTQNVTVPVNVAVNSTATQGSDFTLANASAVVLAGQPYVDFVVTLIDDTLDETEIETVILTLGTPTNATLGTLTQHTAQIQDNDAMPVVSIQVNPSYHANNPESISGIVVDILLSHASGNTVTVPFTIGGTATRGLNCQNPGAGIDFCLSTTSPVSIPPNTTRAQFSLVIVDDAIYGEPNETIELFLGVPTGAMLGLTHTSITYTINENDLCPSISPMPNPNGSKLDLTVSNPSDITVLLTSISIYWYDNPSDQSLDNIYLGSQRIWDTGADNSPATISSGWPSNANKREIDSGDSATLSFVFLVSPLQTSSSDYVSLTFDNGCTISVRRSN